MRGTAAPTRRRILDAAYGLFYRNGFARVGVDQVAARAGVTKRTLYYHFDSKDALLAAVLELQHELALARIRQWGDKLPRDPAAMVESLFADLAAWSRRRGWAGAGFTRLVMELADLPGHPARAAASRHKRAIEDWLAAELGARGMAAPEARAREIALLLEGTTALILIHRDPTIAAAAAAAARRLLGA
ncbi:MAG: helix-turn-helix domain-containing protein [Dongiaceae bacterium]